MQTLLLYVEDVLAVAALETAASSRDAAAVAAAKAAAAARAAAVVLPVLAVPDDDNDRPCVSSPASPPASPSSIATPTRPGSRSPRARRRRDSPVLSPSFLPFADRLMAGLFDCVLHPLLLFTLAAGEP